MTKKILAILMALTLVLSFAACGAKTENETTTEPETEVAETVEDATEAVSEEVSEEVSEDASEAVSEDASEAVSEDAAEAESTEAASEEETTEAAKMPETKEEIIEYYNTAANKVKTDAKSVTSPYSKITLSGKTVLPSAVNGVLKLLGGADKFLGEQLAKNSRTTSETYNGSAEIKEKFPVEGESYASKLTPADVKSASCKEENGKYVITITTVADSKSENIKHGQGHAPKAFNVVLPGIVNDNIPGVAAGIAGTASMDYPSSTLKVVIDPATGNLESGVYDLYWTINFDKIGVILPFLTSTSYTVKF